MRPTGSPTPPRDATPSVPHNATPATTAPTLTQRERLLAAAIAEHLAELLHDRTHVRLVDAATLATALGVSRDFVYAHASELGGERIGSGPRGRLRFDLNRARAACAPAPASKEPSEPPTATSKRRRRKPTGGATRLLPIRGTAPNLQASQGRP
jgi:hypothetical protein